MILRFLTKIYMGTLFWALHKRNERIFVSGKMERTPMLGNRMLGYLGTL